MNQEEVRKALVRLGRRCLRHQLITSHQFREMAKHCKYCKKQNTSFVCTSENTGLDHVYCVLEECVEVQGGRVQLYQEQIGGE